MDAKANEMEWIKKEMYVFNIYCEYEDEGMFYTFTFSTCHFEKFVKQNINRQQYIFGLTFIYTPVYWHRI